MTLLNRFLIQSQTEFTGMKLGLDRVRAFLEAMGNPQAAYPSLLIAGTNGKGSVVRILESVLTEAGYRVGAYTSPHLQRFTERIRIGGAEVGEEEVEAVLQEFRGRGWITEDGEWDSAGAGRLTWFETATVIAFEIFRRRQVPLALLEVGLGGRLDATNTVEPLASAIVSIGRDHVGILGHSPFEIAREKAGVMREGRPVVLGEMAVEVREFLIQAAYLQGAKPLVARHVAGSNEAFAYGPYSGMSLGLLGNHQMRNLEVALELLEIISSQGFPITEVALRGGLEKVRNPGRLELIPGTPPILLDGAHNPEALEALVAFVKKKYLGVSLTLILGMMQDKEALRALQILKGLEPRFLLTRVDSSRSLPSSEWRDLLRSLNWEGEVFERTFDALERAQEISSPDNLILVTGSLYLVGEIRGFFYSQPSIFFP